jgi:hypothetical protein
MTQDYEISKILSPNDCGETDTHQAGILIPKDEKILRFFPVLNSSSMNPRIKISFADEHQKKWEFNFIYYNNRFFGGTRDEFRLTGMTSYLRSNNLSAGDEIFFRVNFEKKYFIRNSKHVKPEVRENDGKYILKLGSKWKILSY